MIGLADRESFRGGIDANEKLEMWRLVVYRHFLAIVGHEGKVNQLGLDLPVAREMEQKHGSRTVGSQAGHISISAGSAAR